MDYLDHQDIAAQDGRGERQEAAGVEKSLGDCEKISQLCGKTAHSTHSLEAHKNWSHYLHVTLFQLAKLIYKHSSTIYDPTLRQTPLHY